jgi:uncharacterized Tic20 family protein
VNVAGVITVFGVKPSIAPKQVSDARNFAMLCHILSLAGLVIPFGNVIGPLVMWLVKRDDPFVDEHGKESVNFQISVTIYSVAIMVLMFVLIFASEIAFVLLILAMVVGFVLEIVVVVRAALKASRGESYRYPLSFRFIR